MEIRILKKNYKIERLNTIKIETSIKNTALDIGLKLSDKEVKLIVREVLKRLDKIAEIKNRMESKGEYITSFYEIRGVILSTLNDMKYEKVAIAYNEYK